MNSNIWSAFLSKALKSKSLLLYFKNVLRPEMFKDNLLSQIYALLCNFYEKYQRVPTLDEMLTQLRTLTHTERERSDEYDSRIRMLFQCSPEFGEDVLVTETVEAARGWMIEQLMLEGATMVDVGKVNYEKLLSKMREISNLSPDLDLGQELSSNTQEVIGKALSRERFEAVPTGIRGADAILRGGWYKRQFACAIGPSGSGKSAFLINHAVGAALAGKNVILVTCELPDLSVIERVVRRIAKMSRTALREETDKAVSAVEKFFRFTHSRLVVKYWRPGQLSVVELESYLDRVQAAWNLVPDLVVIDYLDEMQASSDDKRKELRHQHRGLARDLGGLAKAREIAIVSATQTNRQALGKRRITEKFIGEDYGKVQVSDVIYAICQTEEEDKQNQARLYFLKVREGPGRGREVPVSVDFEKMVIDSLEPKTFKNEEGIQY